MRMIKTHLVNTCQHADLEVEFAPGLNGVYGRNGQGKSNLMNVGGYANLTNDYRRTNGPQEACIRRGIGAADPSYYVTNWEHNGTLFTIKRDLRRKTHELTLPGKKKVTSSAKEIQTWLDSTLGIRRQVIDNYLFVAQLEMLNFIDQSPTERGETFAHLCGTTYMKKIYELLGERIKDDSKLAATVVDNSDELRKRIGEEKKKRREAKAEIVELKKSLLSQAKRKSLKALLSKRAAYRKSLKKAEAVATELTAAESAAEAAATASMNSATALTEATKAETTAKTKLDELTAAAKAYKDAKKINDDRDAVQKKLDKLTEPKPLTAPPTPPKHYAQKNDLLEERTLKKAELKAAQELIDAFDEEGTVECPMCHTPVDALHDHLEHARQTVVDVPVRIKELNSLLSVCDTYEIDATNHREAAATYREAVATYKTSKQSYEDQLTKLKTVTLPKEVKDSEVQAQRTKYEAATKAKNAADAADRRAVQAATAANARLETAKKQATEQAAEQTANKVSKKAALAARKKLDDHDDVTTKLATQRERLASANTAITAAEADIAAIVAAKARVGTVQSWLDDLETMRDDVFHSSQLPKAVHEDALDSLLDNMNETLEEVFNAPFIVRVGEGLAFTAVKADGDEDVRRLSGGQKAVLAIAFRLAINSLFASEIGMMVLDEPTVGLDKENIDCLHDALTSLAAFARKRGSQIIIITHDERLESAFDKVIKL